MATSKCPRCEGTSFEIVEAKRLKDANFRMNFIQCSSCGTVVGVTSFHDVSSLLIKLAERLGVDLFGPR